MEIDRSPEQVSTHQSAILDVILTVGSQSSKHDIDERTGEETPSPKHPMQEGDSPLVSRFFDAVCHGNYPIVKQILQDEPDLANSIDKTGSTALQLAIDRGYLSIARSLLPLMRPDMLDLLDKDSYTVIGQAAVQGHLEIFEDTLRKRPDLANKASISLGRMLKDAAFAGDALRVRNLLKFPPDLALQHVKESGRTALSSAASEGHFSIVQDLLKAIEGPIYIESDADAVNPLFATAKGKGDVGIATLLHKRQPDLMNSVTDDTGDSVLHLAAARQFTELALKLLELEPSLAQAVNQQRETVLHVATKQKLEKLVGRLLFSPNVEVNAKNVSKKTALDLIEEFESSAEVERITKLLLNSGAKRGRDSEMGSMRHYIAIEHDIHTQAGQTLRTGSKISRMEKGMNKEGIKNATNTVVVVAVLIATLAFAALFTVPGGVQQSGREAGSALLIHTAAFQIFFLSDALALFTSLALVIVLVAIIPLQDRFRRKLLAYSNKVIWVAVACCAIAYIATAYIVAGPHKAHVAIIVCIMGIGILATVFIAMSCFKARHYKKKRKWRKSREEKKKPKDEEKGTEEGDDTKYNSSTDSDFNSERGMFYSR